MNINTKTNSLSKTETSSKVPENSFNFGGKIKDILKDINILNSDKILFLSPGKFRNYINQLKNNGKLDSFFNLLKEDSKLVAYASWWQKWLPMDIQKEIDKISNKMYENIDNENGLPLDLDKKYTKEELDLIFDEIFSIQLNHGCSGSECDGYCEKCGFDAPISLRSTMPFFQVKNVIKKYGDKIKKNKGILFYASEPTNYNYDGKKYIDVQDLLKKYYNYTPNVTTKETRLDNLEENGFALDASLRISLRHDKDKVLNGKFKTASGGFADFGMYFKGDTSVNEGYGIACFNGILLTPRGLYNTVQIKLSYKYPQGQVIIPFDKFTDTSPEVGTNLEQVLLNYIVEKKHRFNDKNNGNRIVVRSKNKKYEIDYSNDGILTKVVDITKLSSTKEYFNKKFYKTSSDRIKSIDLDGEKDFDSLRNKYFYRGKYNHYEEYLNKRDQLKDLSAIFDEDSSNILINIEGLNSKNITQKNLCYYGSLGLEGFSGGNAQIKKMIGIISSLEVFYEEKKLVFPTILRGAIYLKNLFYINKNTELIFPKYCFGLIKLTNLVNFPDNVLFPKYIEGGFYLTSLQSLPEGSIFPEYIGYTLDLAALKNIGKGSKLPKYIGKDLLLNSLEKLPKGFKLPEYVGGKVFLGSLDKKTKENLRKQYPNLDIV